MFLTSDEQEDFRQAVRQMCEDKVAPHAAECDEKAQYPWHAHEAFSAMGLMGLTFPEDCGGSGADHVTVMPVSFQVTSGFPGASGGGETGTATGTEYGPWRPRLLKPTAT